MSDIPTAHVHKLLPCPFCGAEITMQQFMISNKNNEYSYQAICKKCHSGQTGLWVAIGIEDKDRVEKKIADSWNNRFDCFDPEVANTYKTQINRVDKKVYDNLMNTSLIIHSYLMGCYKMWPNFDIPDDIYKPWADALSFVNLVSDKTLFQQDVDSNK